MGEYGYSMPRYFQNMPGIGTELQQKNAENEEILRKVEADAKAQADAANSAGKSDEDVHKSGQMTPMERINHLIDDGSWCPLNSLYNPYNNADGSTCVITGMAKVDDRWCIIIASDHKKLAGVWVGGQAYKLVRALDTALKLRIPVVYLLNCSGIKFDEQDRVFPGRITGGTPFYRHSELAQNGIPVIVGIFGTNPAGGGYHSVSPTILIAHEKANMAVGGAGILGGMKPKGFVDMDYAMELINNTKNAKKVPAPGRVEIHYNKTGFFREVYGTEDGVIDALKKYVAAGPAYNENYFRVDEPAEPKFPKEDLYTVLTANQRKSYNVYEVLARIFDNSEFMAYKPTYGPEIFCGLVKVNGLLTAVIGNTQGLLMNYPEYKEEKVGIGGKLYRQGLIKMSEFVTLCNRDSLPIIWFQDTTGIDVGDPAEDAELLALGQSLMFTIQKTKNPQMEVTLRKATGAAHYVLGGPQGTENNVFSIGTAAGEYYVMHGETAAIAMYSRRLVKDYDAGKDIQPIIDKMNEVINDYQAKSTPSNSAKQGWIDEVVALDDLRKYICAFVGAAYQNPASVTPFHQMIVPRIIKDWNDEHGVE